MLLSLPYAKVVEWAGANSTRKAAFEKHVVARRALCAKSQNAKSEKATKQSRARLTPAEALDILRVKSYCCRALFLTYVEIGMPDPDYLEKTFSRVKFLNKRHRDSEAPSKAGLGFKDLKAKRGFLIAR